MPLSYNTMPIFEWNPDSYPVLPGDLGASGLNPVSIRVWKEGVELVLASSGCSGINGTNYYVWSAQHLPKTAITAPFNQFHYEMKYDATHLFNGDVIFKLMEDDGNMPSINDQSSYLIRS